MRLPISAALLAAIVAAAGTGIDLAAAPPQPNVAVKVSFADGGDKIASDGSGLYVNGSGVYANIEPRNHGNLVIYSTATNKKAPARQFRLTFDDCIGSCDDVPFVTSLTRASLIAGVRKPDGTPNPGGLLTMPFGPGAEEGFRAGLYVYLGSINSVHWTLCMSPGDAGGFCANSTGEKSSTPTRIVRTANDKWTISADSDLPRSDVGALFTNTDSGSTSVITLKGKYAMPFSMTVCAATAATCP